MLCLGVFINMAPYVRIIGTARLIGNSYISHCPSQKHQTTYYGCYLSDKNLSDEMFVFDLIFVTDLILSKFMFSVSVLWMLMLVWMI